MPGIWPDPRAELLQAAPVVAAGVLYAVRVRNLSLRGRPVGVAKQACFYAGLATLLVAVASPLHELGERRLLYAHMSQHLLLGDIAPLLIVLGLDGSILRPVLAFPPVRRLRFLAHPAVALPLWVVNLYVWHLPVLYEGALAHDALHALQHELFFVTGALMWAAVAEPLPGPAWFGAGWKAVYVLAVRTAGGVLANVFIWAGQPFYGSYAAGERAAGIEPLRDQTIGGSIMLIEGAIVTLAAFAWLFLRWTREAELRQGLIDGGAAPAVAGRAARYGRSALARARR
jgi:putative membrane protein